MSRRRRNRRKPPDLPVNSASDTASQPLSVQREEHLFSGPLPAPEILRGYDDILPGAAERIIRMAEKEQTNAHESGMLALREAVADRKRGQIIAGIVAPAALGTSAFLGHNGHAVAASSVGGATAVGLLPVFLAERRSSGS